VRSVLGSQPLPTVGDAARLQQAIAGILSNAVKFTPAGGAITVRLESRGDRARLTVSDTGEGIALELLPRIFDRDRERDNRTTRPHGGLGLGLSIVRRLVEMHGGFVRAESGGARKGATFTVELPLNPAQGPVTQPEPAEEVGPAEDRLHDIRLLVVDDDADTRDLMAVMLREQGATVAAVGSVADAYRQVAIFAPDVVLCDISMPGEDGFRLLEWLKAGERRTERSIPVIALTARARIEDRHRILEAGFRDYIAKPLELPDLIRVILRAAGRAQPQ
jgi:CheY-like chemotaxis protein